MVVRLQYHQPLSVSPPRPLRLWCIPRAHRSLLTTENRADLGSFRAVVERSAQGPKPVRLQSRRHRIASTPINRPTPNAIPRAGYGCSRTALSVAFTAATVCSCKRLQTSLAFSVAASSLARSSRFSVSPCSVVSIGFSLSSFNLAPLSGLRNTSLCGVGGPGLCSNNLQPSVLGRGVRVGSNDAVGCPSLTLFPLLRRGERGHPSAAMVARTRCAREKIYC